MRLGIGELHTYHILIGPGFEICMTCKSANLEAFKIARQKKFSEGTLRKCVIVVD